MEEREGAVYHTMSSDETMQTWKSRETWKGKFDFFMACMGFSIGLGNVWRFPYLCYKNGGGAFLIPYFISIVVGGLPISFLELSIGQFTSRCGPQAWKMVPLFQGIGLAAIFISFFLTCFYNMILAWAFHYLFSSFTTELPWEACGHEWNTPNCSDNFSSTIRGTNKSIENLTDPVTEFWEHKVLKITDGLEDTGNIKWDIALCLLLAWIAVYACVCRGIKSSGKVVYFTATAPYIFMLILLVRNCTLDGASDGIEFYLKANVSKLKEITVWTDAGTQIFFSWATGYGILTVLGSYNKFNHNSLRDAMAFTIVNVSTSFLAGFIVFTILGFMAKQQGVLVSEVAESGPGLAFIAYPKAVAQLPISPLWSMLFFVMVILLGLDSQFAGIECVISSVVDQFPRLLRKGYRKEMIIVLTCSLLFLAGLPMTTEGGMYIFQMFNFYCGSRVVLLFALSELTAVSYFYGVRRFSDNIRMMIGKRWTKFTLPYLRICWTVFSPAFCLIMLVLSLYNYSELTYKRPNHPVYSYPAWSAVVGWSITALLVIWIPLVAIYKVLRLIWMGGRFVHEDFRLLVLPYFLFEHQKRPQDKYERCLADFEADSKGKHGSNNSHERNAMTRTGASDVNDGQC